MRSGPVKLLHRLFNIHILLFGASIVVFYSCASSEKLHVLGGKTTSALSLTVLTILSPTERPRQTSSRIHLRFVL